MADIEASPAPSSGVRIAGEAGVGGGRGLFANISFSPGGTVATFGKPLLALPDGFNARSTCNWCLRAYHDGDGNQADLVLRACTGCKAVVYCSGACQRAHWKQVHRDECKAFGCARARAGRDWLPAPVRALVQILLRDHAGDATVTASFGPAGSLRGNERGFRSDAQAWADVQLASTAAIVYAGLPETPETLERAAGMLCKIHTNAFNRLDADTNMSGIFLEPVLAMANHSCTPNAFVSFDGRVAVLRAVSGIREGEEIRISYIDYTLPRAQRHNALRLYHFNCTCSRCEYDLNVYQVCKASTVIALNSLSLAAHIERLANPPAGLGPPSEQVSQFEVEAIFKACRSDAVARMSSATERMKLCWKLCGPLIRAQMWAVEPLPSTVLELRDHYVNQGIQAPEKLAQALSLSCFLAVHCDPFKYVVPFDPWRVKGVMAIAKLLSQTAPVSVTSEAARISRHKRMADILVNSDQVSMCEALLRLVLHWGPMGSPSTVLADARAMLSDIESLQGRGIESSRLQAWVKDPTDTQGLAFFCVVVLEPVEKLAGYAVEIMDSELGRGTGSLARCR